MLEAISKEDMDGRVSQYAHVKTHTANFQELKVDASKALRNAMWRFRSGLSNKSMLMAKDSGDEEVAGQYKIQALWEVASPLAEAWSRQFLLRRFQ